MKPSSFQTTIENQFDYICKRAMEDERKNYMLYLSRIAKREVWELSISDDESGKRIIPIFVNDAMILRPMAGKRLMDVFLDGTSRLTIGAAPNMKAEEYTNLEKLSMEFAYDTFIELKEKQLQLNQESYNKYMYALQLRLEAAQHIGIENIRRGRLAKLEKEKATIEAEHKKGAQVYPDFRLMLAVRLEA